MAKRETAAKKAEPQEIEELTDRYQTLNKRKIEAAANLKTAQKQLADLKKKAKTEYGTDDLEELQQQLRELRDENEQKRTKYQASLDEIEMKLGEVEEEHGPIEEVEAATDEDE
ncbi:MAG: hypothetical protein ACLFVU_13755 [Phycisphaerae bacterium]